MATLTPTLTLTTTDATSDEMSFSVTDSLTTTSPAVGLALVTATTTGANTVIIPNLDATRYFFLRHTGVDSGGSAVTTDLKVEETDENWFARLAPGEFMWVPLNADGGHLIQLEATGGTIIAEYGYWTKG